MSIKKILKLLLTVMGAYFTMLFIGLALVSGIGLRWSSTVIEIKNIDQKEYQRIQKEIKNYVEQKLSWNCEELKGYDTKLSCKNKDNNGNIFVKDKPADTIKEELVNVVVGYSESEQSYYDDSLYFTKQHEALQKHIMLIASGYIKRYGNVQVLFNSPNKEKKLEISN
ncbi:hypothetical protein [Sulfurovum zhangzhouensis]|nr:hypothetical protein [Sulfurovum zhangzhouensis]